MYHFGRCPATAPSWGCAAAPIGFSACLARSHCRACVTAPLIVASVIRGSLKRSSVAWCAWLWDGQPSCCCRVWAGDQPTSVSVPVWRGHMLKCYQSSGVVWSHGQRVCSSGLLPEELHALFMQVGWDARWA